MTRLFRARKARIEEPGVVLPLFDRNGIHGLRPASGPGGKEEHLAEYSVIVDARGGKRGLVLDLGGRKLKLANPRARKMVDEFLLAANCRELLPVVLGAGGGEVIDILNGRYKGPVAVVDKERDILSLTGARERDYPNLALEWIAAGNRDEALSRLTAWQMVHGGRLFYPIEHPGYLALDREHYLELYARLKESNESNFWVKARYPKFRGAPRPLLLRFGYMLERELSAAMKIAGIDHAVQDVPPDAARGPGLVKPLLARILSFKPDFLLTVNFLGCDTRGQFSGLLAGLELPAATWFMDNPENFFHGEALPDPGNLVVFCCDPGHPGMLGRYGLKRAHYLPLAADSARFDLESEVGGLGGRYEAGFIGSSFSDKIEGAARDLGLGKERMDAALELAGRFLTDGAGSVVEYLERAEPEALAFFNSLRPEDQRRYLILVSFAANRAYRLARVKGIMGFKPVIVGDDALMRLLKAFGREFTAGMRIPYYSGLLPRFYAGCRLNFACSNVQMRNSVTQRVFDVPASGGLVLTDMRPQLAEMFDLGREAAAYDRPEEVREAAARYMKDEKLSLRIVNAARRRILAEHTYAHRVREICRVMSEYFGSGGSVREL